MVTSCVYSSGILIGISTKVNGTVAGPLGFWPADISAENGLPLRRVSIGPPDVAISVENGGGVGGVVGPVPDVMSEENAFMVKLPPFNTTPLQADNSHLGELGCWVPVSWKDRDNLSYKELSPSLQS